MSVQYRNRALIGIQPSYLVPDYWNAKCHALGGWLMFIVPLKGPLALSLLNINGTGEIIYDALES